MRYRYLAAAASVFAGDLLVKNHIEKHWEDGEEKEILRGRATLTKSHNKGVVLNALEGRPDLAKKISGASWLMLAGYWLAMLQGEDRPAAKLGLSLMVGGGASNLYDRETRGHVVDYLRFHAPWKALSRVVFNLSDLGIILGSVLYACFRRGEDAGKPS